MTALQTTIVALVLPAAALGACASAPTADGSKTRRDCITTREINAMSPMGDRHVFVKVGASRHYLFTVERACQALELARRLTIWEASSRVCGDATSLLAFEHATAGPMRCRIEKIESVPDKAAAMELIAAETPPK